ncbi:MAG: hypothetical protein EOP85_09360 [Verrucomicrobiaceae bacterium]|nr:MAG: hypothetical protein EOP85_09360 [Verrucomicrobiaceae bacterium]
MGWMLAGLKNWEQGLLKDASVWFSAVTSAKLSTDEEWLSIYQKIASVYQQDLALLEDPVFASKPASRDGCYKAIAELEELQKKLLTRGRARYNVRAWQLDLARYAKLMESGGVEEGAADEGAAPVSPVTRDEKPELADVMATLGEFAGESRFTEAHAYIKNLPADPDGATREALMSIVEHASVLIPDMEADLAKGSVDLPIVMKSGARAIRISQGKEGEPVVTAPDGSRTPTTWGEISPDSLISLHRILVKNSKGEVERMRRHQCAIAFDWLLGNRTRALQAAGQLSQTSPYFKEIWDVIAVGLPQ